ncbi:MAG: CoA-acylating methylmalonate-semialdehyde dehydrogenase, partial [Acidimicrobiia bacterium]
MITHWIGGKAHEGHTASVGDVYDPSTGQVVDRVAFATVGDVDDAVADALEAFGEWHDSSLTARARILFAYRELLSHQADDLARMVSRQHGKTLPDAQGEVARGLEVVEFACGIPHLLKGDFSQNVSHGVDTLTIRQPLGVVAGITPFNFPAMVPMWMYPMAIATGNTFVLKPSEKDPSVSLMLAELFTEAGLPSGVFNVVHGDKVAVNRLLTHPDVRAVSFVGSTPIARYVHQTATASGKRVQALAGAKNHMVVLPDADMDLAADAAVSAGFGSAGERCMAISVLVLVGGTADALLPKIEERIARLKVGPGLDPDSDMGPLVTPRHRDRVVGYIDKGLDEGATLLADGRTIQVSGHEEGFFVGPTLFDHVTTDMTIYRDEIFGPVLSVVRVETFEEAIRLVNDNPWGNGTAVFTNDG